VQVVLDEQLGGALIAAVEADLAQERAGGEHLPRLAVALDAGVGLHAQQGDEFVARRSGDVLVDQHVFGALHDRAAHDEHASTSKRNRTLDGTPFNNAGIQVRPSDAADEPAENFDRVNAVDLRGVWTCMKHELRQKHDQGSGADQTAEAGSASEQALDVLACWAATLVREAARDSDEARTATLSKSERLQHRRVPLSMRAPRLLGRHEEKEFDMT
jgi:NAD(P)-dependent dehydrogenase (short-subunit alcohol dehydrogenase family)